ncbi:hypothetical protein BGW37DRAFT_490165 [Umbelopsis sp. PMI_123]|nr:hypothetical protein BGW37DRAFT_490165 [Umbelopsis sp. PMI_123]
MDYYTLVPFISLPATCELCHQWLPNHSATCPRKGKPPSQWSRGNDEDDEEEIVVDTDIQRVKKIDC